jgi:hypothetical protein
VIPLLNTGTPALDPDYLKNINKSGQAGRGIESCFPTRDPTTTTNSAALFAHYVTCFDGYTGHANTQNIEVFVSTVGLPVSSETLTNIVVDTIPGVIELPVTVSNLYILSNTGAAGTEGSGSAAMTPAQKAEAAARAAARAAGSRADPGGVTRISLSDFPKYITITSFSSDMSNIRRQKSMRNDPTSAYQCVELDPESVDANKNIHIDLKTGQIASTTLDDILAERAVIKEMLTPNEALKFSQSPQRKYFEVALAFMIIVLTMIGLMYYFDNYDNINNRNLWQIVFVVIIAAAFAIATALGILSKDDNIKGIAGWLAFAGLIASFLVFMWFVIIFPPPLTTECGTAILNLSSAAIGTLTNITVDQAKSMDATQAKGITQIAAQNMTKEVAAAFCPAAASAIPAKVKEKIDPEVRKSLKVQSSTGSPITGAMTGIGTTTGGYSFTIVAGAATVVGLLGFIIGNLF